jgi:dienelactone hydrolase
MNLRLRGCVALVAVELLAGGLSTLRAQIPNEDARNTYVPNTDTHLTMPEYRTLAQWEARKVHLRKQILAAAGLLPLPAKTEMHPVVFGRLQREGYSIEKVYLESLPGFYVCGNLYRPMGKTGKRPGALLTQGHWTYGRLENRENASAPTLGVSLARQGYVAFSYDMVGYNDMNQTPHAFGSPREQLWSFGPLGLQLWDSIRALDFLESLEDVDTTKIAMTGASGGGSQTFLLTAIDDRVRYSAPVNMVSGYMQGGDFCENAPGLRFDTSNVEIAAMMAPRPMLLVSATGDWTSHVPAEEFPAIRKIYELYGKGDAVDNVHIDAPHNYNAQSRAAVYKFFGRQVLGRGPQEVFEEKEFEMETLQDMLVFHGRPLPPGALTYDQVFAKWKENGSGWTAGSGDAEGLRETLRFALGTEWPDEVQTKIEGQEILLSRPARKDRIPGVWLPSGSAAALVIDPRGAEAARKSVLVQELVKAGRSVLLIDCFQTGSAVAPRNRSHQFFTTFNRTDDANRVQDILTALAFLTSRKGGAVELYGTGEASIWCLFADAIAPIDLALHADTGWFRGSEAEYLHSFSVPGIERAGGVGAAQWLAAHKDRHAQTSSR